MNMLDQVLTWFSESRRRAVYAALGSLTALLVGLGIFNDVQADSWLSRGQQALALIAALVALRNMKPDDVMPEFDVDDPEAEVIADPGVDDVPPPVDVPDPDGYLPGVQ